MSYHFILHLQEMFYLISFGVSVTEAERKPAFVLLEAGGWSSSPHHLRHHCLYWQEIGVRERSALGIESGHSDAGT